MNIISYNDKCDGFTDNTQPTLCASSGPVFHIFLLVFVPVFIGFFMYIIKKADNLDSEIVNNLNMVNLAQRIRISDPETIIPMALLNIPYNLVVVPPILDLSSMPANENTQHYVLRHLPQPVVNGPIEPNPENNDNFNRPGEEDSEESQEFRQILLTDQENNEENLENSSEIFENPSENLILFNQDPSIFNNLHPIEEANISREFEEVKNHLISDESQGSGFEENVLNNRTETDEAIRMLMKK